VIETPKYPETGENVPQVEKCYLCGEWKVVEHLYSIHVKDQGGGLLLKPACELCLKKAKKEGPP
jgi:hypothetical protein